MSRRFVVQPTALPSETAPCYLIRDRDGVYDAEVRRLLDSSNIVEVVTPPLALGYSHPLAVPHEPGTMIGYLPVNDRSEKLAKLYLLVQLDVAALCMARSHQ